MTRLLAAVLILAGLALVIPQIFTPWPDQRMVAAGITLALIGGLLLTDSQPRASAENRRTDGNRRG